MCNVIFRVITKSLWSSLTLTLNCQESQCLHCHVFGHCSWYYTFVCFTWPRLEKKILLEFELYKPIIRYLRFFEIFCLTSETIRLCFFLALLFSRQCPKWTLSVASSADPSSPELLAVSSSPSPPQFQSKHFLFYCSSLNQRLLANLDVSRWRCCCHIFYCY